MLQSITRSRNALKLASFGAIVLGTTGKHRCRRSLPQWSASFGNVLQSSMHSTVAASASNNSTQISNLNNSVQASANDSVNLPKIAVIGSGNFGTAIARRLAVNRLARYPQATNDTIKMWVYQEEVDGKNLTDIINEEHINTKYLPNVLLPDSVVALSDLPYTCYDADIIIFILSHKHLPKILNMMKGHTKPSAIGVSLIKGVDFTPEGPALISDLIQKELKLLETTVVMGANLASDVAYDRFIEATVASHNITTASQVAELLDCSCVRTQLSEDVATVEYCGALKNIVAVGAGFCDGMGLGGSSKAALIRQGVEEMATFCRLFDSHGNHDVMTLMKSCGIADVIATSAGGRNRLCSSAFAQRVLSENDDDDDVVSLEYGINSSGSSSSSSSSASTTNVDDNVELHRFDNTLNPALHMSTTINAANPDSPYTIQQLQLMNALPDARPTPADPWQSQADAAAELWKEIEAELLNGQVLQGVDTCKEVVRCLQATGHIKDGKSKLFPLFTRIHAIACEGENLNTLLNWD